ncbi:MAG: hypothetical protein H0T89_06865 [Deltaproteobacteria bacterium]|nr:hypothetical protein [Deltaproteobacteria bacterium]MDQ3296762.1 hypothetical protein [Myxococcota bacterium]
MADPTAKPAELDLSKADEHDIARAVKQLKPEEALFFLAKLEAVIAKRKVQLTGYLVAFTVWLVATFLALAYYGTHDGFVGWIFLVPFALVGMILYAFGMWAEKVGNNTQVILDREAKAAEAKAATEAKNVTSPPK